MRKTSLFRLLSPLLMITAACAPAPPAAPIPPVPSTPPPAPPTRAANVARVSGVVMASDGHRVGGAHVNIRAANAACVATGSEVGAVADAGGDFSAAIEGETGAAYSGCVRVEAESGGVRGEVSVPAYFTSSTADTTPVVVTVRLEAPQPLHTSEAARLVQLLADAINNPASAGGAELALYIAEGSEPLRVALEQYRTLLGTVTRVVEIAPSYTPSASYRHHTFAMTGSSGRTLNVDVHQESVTRLHSSILDYGLRSARFVNAYLRAIAAGDAERLARILNPDDVEFPVERARAMIVDYRKRFGDTAAIRAEFIGVDDSRATITWRLRGERETETLVLRHGDGLIGVVPKM